MKLWTLTKLGEIAPIVRRPIEVKIGTFYPELGIRSFGKGTFHKPAVRGSDIGSKRLFKIEPGDLIFSNVFAWEGAVAVAGVGDGERYGSHRFITCAVDPDRAIPEYLFRYFTGSHAGLAKLRAASPGGAGRNRTLGVEKLGEIEVPLPSRSEQLSIVTRLNAITDRARKIEKHLTDAESAAGALLLSIHFQLADGRFLKLGEILEIFEDSEPVRSEGEYPQVGVRGFGGGLFAKSAMAGTDTSYKAFNRLYADAVVLSQVKGWEGALALCPPELAGRFVSPEYRTFRCIPDQAYPAYIGELIRTPWFWGLLQDATRGVGARRERTRPEQFLNIELPMPKLEDQQKAVKILSRLSQLRSHHQAIRTANEALIPATLERIFCATT